MNNIWILFAFVFLIRSSLCIQKALNLGPLQLKEPQTVPPAHYTYFILMPLTHLAIFHKEYKFPKIGLVYFSVDISEMIYPDLVQFWCINYNNNVPMRHFYSNDDQLMVDFDLKSSDLLFFNKYKSRQTKMIELQGPHTIFYFPRDVGISKMWYSFPVPHSGLLHCTLHLVPNTGKRNYA